MGGGDLGDGDCRHGGAIRRITQRRKGILKAAIRRGVQYWKGRINITQRPARTERKVINIQWVFVGTFGRAQGSQRDDKGSNSHNAARVENTSLFSWFISRIC